MHTGTSKIQQEIKPISAGFSFVKLYRWPKTSRPNPLPNNQSIALRPVNEIGFSSN